MSREGKNEQAFTGLEAAIIFIAFVVVASVFSYVVLGMGMTTSQKSQEVVHAALDEARSAFRPGDAVIVKLDTAGGLSFIEFDLETAAGPTAIDMESVTCTIATTEALFTFPPGDPAVDLSWRYRRDTDDVLEAGEVVTVRLTPDSTGIGRGDTFTIGVTATGGETASLTRTIPAGAGENVYIELF